MNKISLILVLVSLFFGLASVSSAKIYINGSNSGDSFGMEIPDVQQPYSYFVYHPWYSFIWGTINARNGTTGKIDYSSTNLTLIWNSMMNALPNGGIIEFGIGSFPVSYSLIPYNNIWIKGQGIKKTVLLGQSDLHDAVIKRTPLTIPSTNYSNPLNNFKITDIEIDGSNMAVDCCVNGGNTGGKGIFFQYYTNSTFRDVYIHDTPTSCFGNDYGQNIIYDADTAINCGRAHPVGGAGESSGGSGFGIGTGEYLNESTVITNSFAFNNWLAGVTFEAVSTNHTSRYLTVSNTYSKNNKYGFAVWSFTNWGVNTAYTKIVDNIAEGNSGAGIYIYRDTYDTTISNNNIISNAIGIQTSQSTAQRIKISGNHIALSTNYGIDIRSNYTMISGNDIRNSGLSGIRVVNYITPAHDIDIFNNQIYNNGVSFVSGERNGILVINDITNVSITNNRIFDDTISKPQQYGITYNSTNTPSNVVITGNIIYGNAISPILDNSGGIVNQVNNYGVSPYFWGVKISTPYAFGVGDTYINSSKSVPNICQSTALGTTNWIYANNGSSGC